MSLSAEEIIASASKLSPDDQAAVDAAWKDEIGRRIEGIKNGRVNTTPAEEAERMVRRPTREGVSI